MFQVYFYMITKCITKMQNNKQLNIRRISGTQNDNYNEYLVQNIDKKMYQIIRMCLIDISAAFTDF